MKRSHWVSLIVFGIVCGAFAQEYVGPIESFLIEMEQPVVDDAAMTQSLGRLYWAVQDGELLEVQEGDPVELLNELTALLSVDQELMDEVDMADLMTIMEDIRYELVP